MRATPELHSPPPLKEFLRPQRSFVAVLRNA